MKLPFGRHKGEDIENVPMSYLWTLWEENYLKEGPLKEGIRQRIEPDRYDIRLNEERTPSTRELYDKVKRVLGRITPPDRQEGVKDQS